MNKFLLLLLLISFRGLHAQQAQSGWVRIDTRSLFDKTLVPITNQIVWQSPLFDTTNLAEDKLYVQILIPLNEKFKIFKNQVVFRLNGEDIESKTKKMISEDYRYTVTDSLRIPIGTSSVEAIFTDKKTGKEVKSKSISVIRRQPTLYLISIGIASDLQYTEKDAKAIDSVFNNQGKAFYKEVKSLLLASKEETKASEIKKVLALHLSIENVQAHDLVILSISGHGIRTIQEGKEDFGIQGSDYNSINSRMSRMTTLHYREDIIKILEELPCKAIVLLDACHSGVSELVAMNSKGNEIKDLAQAYKVLYEVPKNVITIVSSSESELSFEDAQWQHGAFTKCVADGLSKISDDNNDRYITIKELANYVIKAVPILVKQRGYPQQTPKIIYQNKKEVDFPIFKY